MEGYTIYIWIPGMTSTHIHTCTYIHTCTHPHTYMHTHTSTHMHHIHTHARTCTHTSTHMHTHTYTCKDGSRILGRGLISIYIPAGGVPLPWG